MLAGAGKCEICLEGVLPFDGFDAVQDPLFVRVLVFQNPDDSRCCLVSVDATSMRDDSAIRDAATSALGCDEDAVWVCVTHTFSVPHVRTPEHLASDAERERNVLLAERLASAVRAACVSALGDLVPIHAETARGLCSINVNRDVETPDGWWLGANPQGFSDRSVRVLRIMSKDHLHRTIATLYSVDVQSSVVQGLRDADGRVLVSADLAGEASRLLEDHLGGVAVFLVGTAGDQTPRVTGAGALPELGRILAAEVEAALSDAGCLRIDTVKLERHVVTCAAQHQADFHSLAPSHTYQFVEEGTVDTTLSVAHLGHLTVVGVEPELDSVLGARIREMGGGSLEVLTMVNGAQKYLASPLSYDRITYEAMNSPFAREASEAISQAILNLR